MISLNNTLDKMCTQIESAKSTADGKISIWKEHWGANDVWTIYKFSNGYMWAFRRWTGTLTYYTNVAGLYAYKDRYDLPRKSDGSPAFTQINFLDYQMRIGNGFTLSAYSNSTENTGQRTDYCWIYALSNSGGSQQSYITLQVYGRWK